MITNEAILGVKPPGPDYLLIIPAIMPSLNEYLRMHWNARRRLNHNTGWHVQVVKGRSDIEHRDRLAHVTIRVYSNAPKAAGGRARRLDMDNLFGAQKPLIDALRYSGIIKNDTDRWLDLGISEYRDQVEYPRTEIDITYNGKSYRDSRPIISPFAPKEKTRAVVSKRGLMMGAKKWGSFPARKKRPNAL